MILNVLKHTVLIILLVILIILTSISTVKSLSINVISTEVIYGGYEVSITNNSIANVGYEELSIRITIESNYENDISVVVKLDDLEIKEDTRLVKGLNSISITLPKLSQKLYNTEVLINSYEETLYRVLFNLNIIHPDIDIKLLNKTELYSGVTEDIILLVENKSLLDIIKIRLVINGNNIEPLISKFIIDSTPKIIHIPVETGKPGKAYLIVRANYTDIGGLSYVKHFKINFTIVKTPTELIVNTEPKVVKYGQNFTVCALLKTPVGVLPGQEVIFIINDEVLNKSITNNEGIVCSNYTSSKFGIGSFIIKVLYNGSIMYKMTYAYNEIEINPGIINLIVKLDSNEVIFNEIINISITFEPEPVGGYLILKYVIDNVSKIIEILTVSKRVITSWKPPSSGNYTLVVDFQGLPYYESVSKFFRINVLKANCKINANIISKSYVLSDVLIIGFLNPRIHTVLEFHINNTRDVVSTDELGNFKYIFKPLKIGNYNLTIIWGGNENYNSCIFKKIISVEKIPTKTLIQLNKSVIASGDLLTIFIITSTHNVEFTDNITGNVILEIISNNTKIAHEVPIVQGKGYLELRLWDVGKYYLRAYFPGNDYFSPSNSGKITVQVIPGVFGISWYVIILHIIPVTLGLVTGLIMKKVMKRHEE